ncbi:MAG: SDR family NAD(P)-dependent oxidoreductase [Deltaproteobacteria bacterium]|nr:SDR family NAD(P)-dependent oxidoreductase [Deltaproteobacteria bacterium]
MKLKDRVAIVTGGGRGLGRSVALAFAREGVAVPTDAANEEQVNQLVQKTLQVYGTVDILVNNAGVRGPIGRIHEISLPEWEETLRINLTSAFLCSRAVIPTLIAKKAGKIINVATTLTPRPNLTPYMVAKAGLIHFTKQLSRELKDFNIQVNAIHPGVMDTQMQKEIRKAGARAIGTDMFDRLKEEGMLHSPDEPAKLVLFLASKSADGITGEYLSFDDKEVKFLISQAPIV